MANNFSQTMFAIVFMILLVAGFAGVAYVEAEFQNGATPSESFWSSDTDTEFGTLWEGPESDGYKEWITTGQWHAGTGTEDYFNKTAVYVDNTTWQYSIADSPDVTNNHARFVMKLNNLDSVILTDLYLNVSMDPPEGTNALVCTIHCTTDGIMDATTGYQAINLHSTSMFPPELNNPFDPDVYVETHVEIDPTTALQIFDAAQDTNEHYLVVYSVDEAQDGFADATFSMSAELDGTPVEAWGLQDSINVVIGASMVANVFAAIYMTDGTDIGGKVRDIKRRGR